MASVINLYRDSLCKDPILQVSPGVAGVVGYYANINNWTIYPINTGLVNDAGKQLLIYATYINQDKNGNLKRRGCDFGFTFSGGSVLYDFDTSGTIIPLDIKTTDKVNTSPGAGNITNAFFTGQMTYEGDLVRTGYVRFGQGIYERSVGVSFGSYYQEPEDAAMQNRQSWAYETSVGYYASTTTFCQSVLVEFNANTRWHYCKMYSITIDEMDCYAFFIGVDFDGSINDSNTDDPGSEYFHSTYIIAVPKDLYKDRVPKPYVGPVTPESAEGFTPPGREFYNDNIIPRVITDTNPFGFNEDDGWGTVRFIRQSKGEWVGMIQQIYHGIGSGLGALSQFVDVATFSPTTVRDAEEVSAMTKGILSCRVLPDFGFPVGAKVNESTICGYPLYKGYSTHKTIGNITDQIIPITFPQTYISRTYNNFLDFEPYTTATLHIPFVGDINIDPSVLYGSVISIEGYVDGFTGLISVDVVLRKNGVEWIYAELQGNCGTEMPIIGAGSTTSQAIGKVASGLGQLASNPVGGVFTMLDGIGKAGKSVPSTVNSNPQMAAYFAQRFCYITINTPLPENPENYAALMGTVVRKEGTVGKYAGYSEFSAVNLSTVNATDAEKQEIEILLKGGVFV